MLWDKAEQLKQQFNDQRRARHREIKAADNKPGHFPAIVLSIDVDDRQDNQIGVNKCDHAAETDAAVPEHGRERDIADRADKGKNGDERTDNWSPYRRGNRMRGEKKISARN